MDVLVPSCGVFPETSYAGFGVAVFSVSTVTEPKQLHPETPAYSADVVHTPCDDNYFHSEVRTLFRGQFTKKRKHGELAKRYLRLRICEHMTVVVQPRGLGSGDGTGVDTGPLRSST